MIIFIFLPRHTTRFGGVKTSVRAYLYKRTDKCYCFNLNPFDYNLIIVGFYGEIMPRTSRGADEYYLQTGEH